MDVNISYWDSTEHKVKTSYFDSQFLERPNADNLLDSINVSTAKLKEDSFLHLAMDGPNVNWDVLNKLDNKLVSILEAVLSMLFMELSKLDQVIQGGIWRRF